MIVRHPWQPPVDAEVRDLFAAEQLTLIGVCDAIPDDEATAEFRGWLARGFHGSMAWLARHAELKYRPQAISDGCRSILFAGLNYYQRPGAADPATPAGRLARYAWGRDYHKELGKRLRRIARRLSERYPDDRFRPFTDATPLAERHFAERAGIGFTGRNTLLINGELGSWFVIGEILSSRAFSASPAATGRHGACPSACARCIDVCPTGALLGPHRIDASRCISYLTIEHDGSIPLELRPLMGDWIFGCDLCQEVCPLNVRAAETDVAGFRRPIAGSTVALAEVLAIEDSEAFTRRFAGSAVMRAGRRRLLRNACLAAGNLRATELRLLLEARRADSDAVISEHAKWALDVLRDPDSFANPTKTG